MLKPIIAVTLAGGRLFLRPRESKNGVLINILFIISSCGEFILLLWLV
jgi:hypothetical protein